eukprot:GEZU01014963.1.p1 GENE.GEZU01014963.1~~GEZU01014963.1.p1  ORF type:complete len:107 (+),score=17.50 GEZU01014963.1:288-608(+)
MSVLTRDQAKDAYLTMREALNDRDRFVRVKQMMNRTRNGDRLLDSKSFFEWAVKGSTAREMAEKFNYPNTLEGHARFWEILKTFDDDPEVASVKSSIISMLKQENP